MEYENNFVGLSSVTSHALEILRYELEYGWTCYRSEGECFGHRWYKHQEYPFTLRYNNFLGIIGVSFNDGKDDTVMIKCVDELQHILFGLQLDSNLKI